MDNNTIMMLVGGLFAFLFLAFVFLILKYFKLKKSQDDIRYADNKIEDLTEDDFSSNEQPLIKKKPEDDSQVAVQVAEYLTEGHETKAIALLNSAIAKNPQNSKYHMMLLNIYSKNNDATNFEKTVDLLHQMGDVEALAKANKLREQLQPTATELPVSSLRSNANTQANTSTSASLVNTELFETPAEKLASDTQVNQTSTQSTNDNTLNFDFDEPTATNTSALDAGQDAFFSQDNSANSQHIGLDTSLDFDSGDATNLNTEINNNNQQPSIGAAVAGVGAVAGAAAAFNLSGNTDNTDSLSISQQLDALENTIVNNNPLVESGDITNTNQSSSNDIDFDYNNDSAAVKQDVSSNQDLTQSDNFFELDLNETNSTLQINSPDFGSTQQAEAHSVDFTDDGSAATTSLETNSTPQNNSTNDIDFDFDTDTLSASNEEQLLDNPSTSLAASTSDISELTLSDTTASNAIADNDNSNDIDFDFNTPVTKPEPTINEQTTSVDSFDFSDNFDSNEHDNKDLAQQESVGEFDFSDEKSLDFNDSTTSANDTLDMLGSSVGLVENQTTLNSDSNNLDDFGLEPIATSDNSPLTSSATSDLTNQLGMTQQSSTDTDKADTFAEFDALFAETDTTAPKQAEMNTAALTAGVSAAAAGMAITSATKTADDELSLSLEDNTVHELELSGTPDNAVMADISLNLSQVDIDAVTPSQLETTEAHLSDELNLDGNKAEATNAISLNDSIENDFGILEQEVNNPTQTFNFEANNTNNTLANEFSLEDSGFDSNVSTSLDNDVKPKLTADNAVDMDFASEFDNLNLDVDTPETQTVSLNTTLGLNNQVSTESSAVNSPDDSSLSALGVAAAAGLTAAGAMASSDTVIDDLSKPEAINSSSVNNDFNFSLDNNSIENTSLLSAQPAEIGLSHTAATTEEIHAFDLGDNGDSTLQSELPQPNVESNNPVIESDISDQALSGNTVTDNIVPQQVPETLESPVMANASVPVNSEEDAQFLSSLQSEIGFIQDTDMSQTNLELAESYIKLGEITGAKILLDEVLASGTAEQKVKATAMKGDIAA